MEHLFPQRQCSEEEKLDYRNLLASCNCGTRKTVDSECDEPFDEERSILMQDPEREFAAEWEHCGGKKKDWYDDTLLVLPLNPECSRYFTFGRMTGAVRPVDDPSKQQAAQETIDSLGLNCSRLQKGRKSALYGATYDLDSLTKEEIRELIQGFGERNCHGVFEEYCFAIVSVLERYLAFQEVGV